MRPEFIFLDLGNVIVSFDRERAMHQMAAESGAEPAVIQAFLTGNDLQQRMERGQIDWSEFHDEFSRCTQTRSDPARFAHAASDMFTLRDAACDRWSGTGSLSDRYSLKHLRDPLAPLAQKEVCPDARSRCCDSAQL